MGLVDISGCHHIRLTVTDLDRSLSFYTEILGFDVVVGPLGDYQDPEVRQDKRQLYGGVIMRSGDLILGLRPVASASDRFESERVGLDHLSFLVASRAVLEDAARAMTERDVVHGEVTDLPAFGIAVLSVDDPDGMHLELSAPL